MKLCIPLKPTNFKKLCNDFKRAQKEADIVEIWFDELENELSAQNLKQLFKLKKKPVIYKVTNAKNIDLLFNSHLDFIDLDLSVNKAIIKKIKQNSKTKLIISFHDFKKTPDLSGLKKIAKKIISLNADIVKIATFANDFTDNFVILKLLEYIVSKNKKAVCLCMGEKGVITRTAGQLFGNYLMFAPFSSSKKTAEGQISIKELKKCL